MADRPTIGDILLKAGRVTAEDVQSALEHQRRNGGYFGEALVALGLVSQEELEWSLASQFDLPYVFPDADSIDPEAAALVTPEWALAHLALPIMRTQDTLTVVVDSPLKSRAIEELQARTDRNIELALASPGRIRELVRQVYSRRDREEPADRPLPVTLSEGFALALGAAAPRFGVSTRGRRAWFWWEEGGATRRRPLQGTWSEELDQLVSPPLSSLLGGERQATFRGELSREGMVGPVEIRSLADAAGQELLFRPVREPSALQERFPLPPSGILSEIRLLARSASARFLVRGDPSELGREILPHLPALLLGPSCRAVHVSVEGKAPEAEVFAVSIPAEPDGWSGEVEALSAFRFDVVSVDPAGAPAPWALAALAVAPIAFVLPAAGLDRRSAYEGGIRWELGVGREVGRGLSWSLDPLQV